MYKDATYKEKFADLQEWIPLIIDVIKKDLRNEHLKKDLFFVKKFLSSKNIHKTTTEDLVEAYTKAIQEEEQGEGLAEFITSRWLLKNSDLYEFFEEHLTQIDPDFSTLVELAPEQARRLIDASNKQFGAPHTYLFSVLNSVVLPEESFHELRKEAQEHQRNLEEEKAKEELKLSEELKNRNDERVIARLTDKYEKKLAGLQKKYIADVDKLKKEVAQLQRKLQESKG